MSAFKMHTIRSLSALCAIIDVWYFIMSTGLTSQVCMSLRLVSKIDTFYYSLLLFNLCTALGEFNAVPYSHLTFSILCQKFYFICHSTLYLSCVINNRVVCDCQI